VSSLSARGELSVLGEDIIWNEPYRNIKQRGQNSLQGVFGVDKLLWKGD
jgi:hypothetical protein